MDIFHIEELAFAGLSTLSTLYLGRTGLMMVPPLGPVKNTLEELHLFYNNISSIPWGYFVGFKKLAVLSLGHNSLYEIPDISPLRSTITKLDFEFNKVNSISFGLNWTVYSQLILIRLTGNAIRTFNSDMMSFLPALQLFELSENNIVQLPSKFPDIDCKNCSGRRPTTCNFFFNRNPIHCDKMVESILTRRQNNSNYIDFDGNVRMQDLWHIKCRSPAHLCGRDLRTLGM